jgi:hypothetical protein
LNDDAAGLEAGGVVVFGDGRIDRFAARERLVGTSGPAASDPAAFLTSTATNHMTASAEGPRPSD